MNDQQREEAQRAVELLQQARLRGEAAQAVISLWRMIERDYPATVKAHFLVHIAFSRLAKVCGVKEVTDHIGRMLGQGLALYSGACVACLSRPQQFGSEYRMCPGCESEQRKFEREAGLDDEESTARAEELLNAIFGGLK